MVEQIREVEKIVLATVLNFPNTYWEVGDFVKPEWFQNPNYKKIWEEIVQLNREGIVPDLVHLSRRLKTFVSPSDIVELQESNSQPTNIVHYAHRLAEDHMAEGLFRTEKALQRAREGRRDPLEILTLAEKAISDCRAIITPRESVSISTKFVDMLHEYEERVKRVQDGSLSGIDTGFSELNKLTGGWQKTDLITVAARPGIGKTAFAISLALAANVKVGFFSMEMDWKQIYDRIAAQITGINLMAIRHGKLVGADFEALHRHSNTIQRLQIDVDDSRGLDISELRVKARQMKEAKNVGMIVVDYLQLLKDKRYQVREREVGSVATELKSIARSEQIPVIALAQLGREVDKRPDKRPIMSDIRESGVVENESDIICFLYRPEKYGIQEFEDGTSTAGMAEVMMEKQRNGITGVVRVGYTGYTTKFYDLQEAEDRSMFRPIQQPIETSTNIGEDLPF